MEKEEGECRCVFSVRLSSACKLVNGISSLASVSQMGNAREMEAQCDDSASNGSELDHTSSSLPGKAEGKTGRRD